MYESKIDLTDRLRREERWEEASLKKDELITQLRSSGKTKKEANQEAWEWVERKYPPLTDNQINWNKVAFWLAAAEHPIPWDNVADQDKPKFNSVWRPYCMLNAAAIRIEADFVGCWEIIHRMVVDAPNKTEKVRALDLMLDPLGFIEGLGIKMRQMIDRYSSLKGLTEDQTLEHGMLIGWVNQLNDLRDFIEELMDEGKTLLRFWSYYCLMIPETNPNAA